MTDLFAGELAPVACPRRRPADVHDDVYQPQFHQVLPGLWVIVVYARSPKNGWATRWEFPLFLGEDGWVAPHDDGDVAPGTYAWDTRADAVAAFEQAHPDHTSGGRFFPGLQRFPSMDQRRRRKPVPDDEETENA